MTRAFPSGSRIVFFGDSVTDCERDRASSGDAGLGLGYVRNCHALLHARFPAANLTVLNRGVSGDRIYDLESRLDRDVLSERPDVVSILIGINDTWQRYGAHRRVSSIEDFLACYRRVLGRLKAGTGAQLVVCEPFLLPVPEDRRIWREDLDPRIQAVRHAAEEFGAVLVPLDGCFAEAAAVREPDFWLPDGVHPSAAGHGVITSAWMAAVCG